MGTIVIILAATAGPKRYLLDRRRFFMVEAAPGPQSQRSPGWLAATRVPVGVLVRTRFDFDER